MSDPMEPSHFCALCGKWAMPPREEPIFNKQGKLECWKLLLPNLCMACGDVVRHDANPESIIMMKKRILEGV